jgi:hypothetical protein
VLSNSSDVLFLSRIQSLLCYPDSSHSWSQRKLLICHLAPSRFLASYV